MHRFARFRGIVARLHWLTALVASACSTVPSTVSPSISDESSGRLRGEFSVYTPLATPTGILEPGTYTGELEQFRRGQVEISFDSNSMDNLSIALNDDAPDFPRSGGRFSFPPAEHNLAYTIAGEYFVEEEDLGSFTYAEVCTELITETICVDAPVETEGGTAASSCYLQQIEVYGQRDVMTSSARRSEDLSVRFLDPETQDLVALYFGSNAPRVETSRTSMSNCRISQ